MLQVQQLKAQYGFNRLGGKPPTNNNHDANSHLKPECFEIEKQLQSSPQTNNVKN